MNGWQESVLKIVVRTVVRNENIIIATTASIYLPSNTSCFDYAGTQRGGVNYE